MLKGLSVAAIGLGVALSFGSVAQAASEDQYQLTPWDSDPAAPDAYTPPILSEACKGEWIAGAGLPDSSGNQNYGLYFQKFAGTFTDSGAGASISGIQGTQLSEIGYDFREDSHCGAGAPRFNVYVQGMGMYYFSLGCYYGNRRSTPTPNASGWRRVRFADEDVYPAYANQSPWPGFGNVIISDLWIVFDEGLDQGNGYFYMDNIDINGTLITKPSLVAPTNVSVSPNSGSSVVGMSRSLSAVYSYANGVGDISLAYLLVGASPTNGLLCYYDSVSNKLYLLNDTGSALLGGFAPGSNNTISNSRGSINCAATTVSKAGHNLTINWSITPTAAFAGTRNLYLYVKDAAGKTDGYGYMGAWNIATNVAPVNVGVSPDSGSSAAGTARSLSAVYSDANGANDINLAYLRVGTYNAGSLLAYYNAATNKLYLLNDAGNGFLGGFAPGSANVISNGQGSLNCSATTVSKAGNNLTVNWSLTPSAAFAGTRSLYLYARDITGATDGYDNVGTWTITASP